MTKVNLTDFRSHASGMFTRVEHGETIVVLRHGCPIAEVSPVKIAQNESAHSWKKKALRLSTKGKSLSSAILEEREHENIF